MLYFSQEEGTERACVACCPLTRPFSAEISVALDHMHESCVASWGPGLYSENPIADLAFPISGSDMVTGFLLDHQGQAKGNWVIWGLSDVCLSYQVLAFWDVCLCFLEIQLFHMLLKGLPFLLASAFLWAIIE